MTDVVLAPVPSSEVVPVDAVDDLLVAVQAGLDQLRAQVAQAEQQADGAELRHRALVMAGSPSGDGAEGLRVALGQVSFAADDQQDAAIAAAEAHAVARVAAARAEAHEIVLQAQVDRAHRLARPVGVTPAPPKPVAPPMQPAALVARARAAATAPSPAMETLLPESPVAEDPAFTAFWEVPDLPARRGATDGLSSLLVGVVGALVLVALLLLLVG